MRGRMACSHCAAEVPHGADHSSPASFQSYSITRLAFARDQARSSLKLKMWLGPELNRRHADFQSAALPTELPSPKHILARTWAVTKAENDQRSTSNIQCRIQNFRGNSTARPNNFKYCSREISIAPNCSKCGVVHCASSSVNFFSRKRSTKATSATFEASVTR